MSSSKNLAQMFAHAQAQAPPRQPSQGSRADVYSSHHSTSKAVDATDNDHFENTTFQLKRTRSMGLLDEFIAPTRKLIEEDENGKEVHVQQQPLQNQSSLELDFDDDDNGQFIENVDDLPKESEKQQQSRNVIYPYHDANDHDDDSIYDENTQSSNRSNSENQAASPSPPSSPDLYQPHDDNDIVYEPSRHVDYLSHNWKESDISKSWRYIVLKRKDVANSARLENASWRTWAQAKYHLKTISPESVNWLKDSDVTWLYGPLYKESDYLEDIDKKYGSDDESSTLNAIKRGQSKKSSTTPGSASSPSTKTQRMGHFAKKAPKPILKKRTVSEMLTQPSMIKLAHHHHPHHPSPPQQQQVKNTPSPPVFEDDFDLISKRVNAQYQKNAQSISSAKPESVASDSTGAKESAKRHIHFNDRVEQCIALNYPDSESEEEIEYDEHSEDVDSDGYENDDDEDQDEDGGSDDDSEDEGGFFLSVKSPSSAQPNRDFAMHDESKKGQDAVGDNDERNDEHNDAQSTSSRATRNFKIIEILPATTLKYISDDEHDETDEEKYALSHRINTSRGYNYHYDYNSVFTSDQNQLINLGGSDYEVEDTPQHLEGVNMVDVPDNIVLGSNIEVVDTPPHVLSPSTESARPRNNVSGAFSLHSEDSDSDSEDDLSSSPHSAVQKSISKVSSSPSYASLSDVAAQGYIAGSPTDLNDLQKEFSNLSSNDDSNKGFKAALMNSWKKG